MARAFGTGLLGLGPGWPRPRHCSRELGRRKLGGISLFVLGFKDRSRLCCVGRRTAWGAGLRGAPACVGLRPAWGASLRGAHAVLTAPRPLWLPRLAQQKRLCGPPACRCPAKNVGVRYQFTCGEVSRSSNCFSSQGVFSLRFSLVQINKYRIAF